MNNFDSRRVELLIEHKIDPKVMRDWGKTQTDKLDNLIIECDTLQHTTLQYIYFLTV